MSSVDDNRKDIVAYRIERAYTALEQAKLNLKFNCLEHSHDGNVTQFGLYFVKTGKVDREDGKLLSHLLTMRLKGDYSDRFGLTEADVLPYMEPTEAFVKEIAALAEQALV